MGTALRWVPGSHASGEIRDSNDRLLARYQWATTWRQPFFHPVCTYAAAEPLTCYAPFDHPWHRGLWRAWKFINGVVFWEDRPFIRPMIIEDPNDALVYGMDLQYYFGREILVAPIYNAEERRPVYLPTGQWIDFHTHEVIPGPVVRWLHEPLGTTPLYIRANALIPTTEPVDHISDGPFSFVTFDAYSCPAAPASLPCATRTGSLKSRQPLLVAS